jgi:hypothetical protein
MTIPRRSTGADWTYAGKSSQIKEDLESKRESQDFPQGDAISSDILRAIERLNSQQSSSPLETLGCSVRVNFRECPKAPPNTPTAILQGRKSVGAISTGDESCCDHLAEEIEKLPDEFLVLSPSDSRRRKRAGARCPALDVSIFKSASKEI